MNALAAIVGDSPGIRRVREQLAQVVTRAATAPRPPPILLRGETGSGKGLVARTVHRAGPRALGPFVEVNCAAIPDSLLEAELFGYERGAFTDARQAKPGLVQLAHRGMLFLDEIGMLSPAVQAKLLKALEDGEVRRLGATRAEPVDVWIISATNEDLAEALGGRRFREDLYHRLAVLSLELPPLRERGEDVLALAERFLARACADYGLPPKRFGGDARRALGRYAWPGNVRELGNVIERVALLVDEPVVTAAMLGLPAGARGEERPAEGGPGRGAPAAAAPTGSSREQMRAHLLEVLTETGWNISQTAVRLGVARNTVLARMARFGLRTAAVAQPSAVAPASAVAPPATARPGGGPRREATGGAPRRDAGATVSTDPPIPLVASATAPPDLATPLVGGPTAPTDLAPPLVARSRPAWEPRQVALLRADVVVDSAIGSARASRAVDEMIGKVQTFGGEILEQGPGALVAAFGLEPVEDAPVRAALAALAMLRGAERARSEGAGPRVKIAVHVAQVLVSQRRGAGTIDLESKRAAWTTIEALVGLDALDSIVVSEAATPFLERRFELTPAIGAGIPFRRLTQRERTGFGLGGRPLSRFVGRDNELRLVMDRLAGAARGQGQVVGIVGEPGVGKSRFVYELTRLDAAHDWRALSCSGVSHASTTPLLAVGDLLRRYFAVEDADEPDLIRQKVTEAVLSRHDQLESSLTPLLSLLDIAVDDPSWNSLDPPQQRQRMQDAVRRLLLSESRIQPLLLIVEDLHWIDAETQALLDGLVESLPRARLALLVNYRPEYQHRWATRSYYSQMRLDALAPERAVELLHALLGDDPALEPLEQLLLPRGNPFFIEETIRALVETQALIGERGAYRLARPIQTIEVPATVQVILAARIERLSADDKRLLQTASVIGKDVPVVLLQAVAEMAEHELHRGLAHLRAAEFLYEARLSPDAEYTFKHALTHEVTYGTLLEDQRTELHARIMGAVESVYPDRLTEHVERLAHHAVRGQQWEQAVTYLHQAGLKASARSANREAVSYFEQALAALGHRPESRETLEQAIDLRFDLKTALYPFGAVERILDYLREAEGMAKTLEDRQRLGQLSVHMCHVLGITGRQMESIAFGENAVALAESLGDIPLQVMGNLYLGTTYLRTGDYPRAEALHLKVLRLLEGERSRERFGHTGFPAVTARGYLTLIFAALGKFDEGLVHGREGVRLAESLDHPYSLSGRLWTLAYLHIARGDFDEAVGLLERGLALAREWNMTFLSMAHTGSLGYAYALMGRTADAFPLLEKAQSTSETMGAGSFQFPHLERLAEACVLAGRLDDALGFTERALTIARAHGERSSEARALWLLGEVAARRPVPEHAEGLYREALALAESFGLRPLIAHCHLGLGRLYWRTGSREQARQQFITATAMYREMQMTHWLEQAEAAQKA